MTLRLRNIAFAIAFYSGSLVLVLLALPCVFLPGGAVIAMAKAWSRWHRFCTRTLLGIRIEVEGDMPQGQALYAIKHESFFEAIDMPSFLDGAPIPFAKIELLQIPLWGRAAARYGVIGVDRATGAKALRHMSRSAKLAKASGRNLGIFPEGTRVAHGTQAPMQSGLYGIYKLIDLPIVPVAVDSGPLYQTSTKRSGTITYRIGKPIPPGLARAELESQVHKAINALNPGASPAT